MFFESDFYKIMRRAKLGYNFVPNWGTTDVVLSNTRYCNHALASVYPSNNCVSIRYHIKPMTNAGHVERNAEAIHLKKVIEKVFKVTQLYDCDDTCYCIDEPIDTGLELYKEILEEEKSYREENEKLIEKLGVNNSVGFKLHREV